MNEYLALGHMREISQKRDDEAPNCYIPYHMVINEKSTTTKCRVVFNASSKTKNGKSLNNVLMTGPKLQTEIFNHLIKFRSYRVAFTADIEKMYRQILISDEDCKYQRIVWRATPSDSLKSFELQTITYGTSCAPFLALRTLQQLYQDEEQNFPLAAKIARENIYIDDLLSGADTEVEAKSIIIEIQNLLKSGGFILRTWSSSHPKVLQDLDTSLLASKPLHSLGDEETKQRVLGLIWNLKTDSIQVKVVHEEIVKTKRQLLSVIAQIFDPLGLFSPSVITLKIMLQELWKSKAFWDDPIPSSILENWNKFTKEMPKPELLQSSNLRYQELSTLLCQIEACINSRPLVPLSSDPADIRALTPGHFLIGEPLLEIPESKSITNTSLSLSCRWKSLLKLRQHFWDRWHKEVLHHYQSRPKWKASQSEVQLGNLVLISDDNRPPLSWPMARILKLIPGTDRTNRVAILQTGSGLTRRSNNKIVVLPI
ncbi:uncharacterized protein TNCV_2155951 [Trichonephila clavipes]|nr:uncharacterized protein TNCV_2155951 [Trichonephila clavipes]